MYEIIITTDYYVPALPDAELIRAILWTTEKTFPPKLRILRRVSTAYRVYERSWTFNFDSRAFQRIVNTHDIFATLFLLFPDFDLQIPL